MSLVRTQERCYRRLKLIDTIDCPCVDPLRDLCYLAYPCGNLCTSGPYNRLKGERLLAMYEMDCRTKGRVMLVDSDLIYYFMLDPSARAALQYEPEIIPERLAAEYAEFSQGRKPGPLMEQERQFERLWHKNAISKHHISSKDLKVIQRQKIEILDVTRMCYCQVTLPDEGDMPKDIFMCSHHDCEYVYFHKSCVKKLGVDKVSRWFCTSCEEKMKMLARQTLRDLGYTDVPNEEDFDGFLDMKNFEQNFEKIMNMPNGIMDEQHLGTRRIGG